MRVYPLPFSAMPGRLILLPGRAFPILAYPPNGLKIAISVFCPKCLINAWFAHTNGSKPCANGRNVYGFGGLYAQKPRNLRGGAMAVPLSLLCPIFSISGYSD